MFIIQNERRHFIKFCIRAMLYAHAWQILMLPTEKEIMKENDNTFKWCVWMLNAKCEFGLYMCCSKFCYGFCKRVVSWINYYPSDAWMVGNFSLVRRVLCAGFFLFPLCDLARVPDDAVCSYAKFQFTICADWRIYLDLSFLSNIFFLSLSTYKQLHKRNVASVLSVP